MSSKSRLHVESLGFTPDNKVKYQPVNGCIIQQKELCETYLVRNQATGHFAVELGSSTVQASETREQAVRFKGWVYVDFHAQSTAHVKQARLDRFCRIHTAGRSAGYNVGFRNKCS